MQSLLKIGSALAERVGQGEVSGSTALPDSAWWRLQLPVEKPWSMTDGPFVCFLAQMGVENTPFTAGIVCSRRYAGVYALYGRDCTRPSFPVISRKG